MLWQWDLARTLGWAQPSAEHHSGCWRRLRSFDVKSETLHEQWSFPVPLGATAFYNNPHMVHTFPESTNGAFVTTGLAPQCSAMRDGGMESENTLCGPTWDAVSLRAWDRDWNKAWQDHDAGRPSTWSDSILLYGLSAGA